MKGESKVEQEEHLNNVTDYMPENPVKEENKKIVELEIDERINSTLDTILGQLDKIRVNMQVREKINFLENEC